jgi:uncharacterized phosphatase
MTTFLLVRHADTDYSGPKKWGVTGWGGDIAPLSSKGIEQVKTKGPELAEFKPDIILCSSMSRALQTVLLLKEYMKDIPVSIEFDLHEWVPDNLFKWQTIEDVMAVMDEMQKYRCEWPEGEKRSWEPFSMVRNRAFDVLKKYTQYERVFVLCHAMLILSIIHRDHIEDVKNLEAFEYVIKIDLFLK